MVEKVLIVGAGMSRIGLDMLHKLAELGLDCEFRDVQSPPEVFGLTERAALPLDAAMLATVAPRGPCAPRTYGPPRRGRKGKRRRW